MRGLSFRFAIVLPLLALAACSSGEEHFDSGPVLQRTGYSGVLARAYADPTVGIGFWKIAPTPNGTRIWYGEASNCPWAGS
jgi:hypothetical protein